MSTEMLKPKRQPRTLEARVARDEHAPGAPEVSRDLHEGGYLHAIATEPARPPRKDAEPERPAPAPEPPLRADVLGVPLAVGDYAEVLDWMEAMVRAGARGYLTAAAVNLVMSAREDPATLRATLAATLIVPDGQPLVWALRLLGARRATRIYGPDLMARFCERAAQRAIPIYLYGGRTPQALELLRERLRERYPGLLIAGSQSPPFRELSAEEERRLAREIDASGAAVVWVGTGQPKQERWMERMRPLLQAPLLVGVGAAFDFHAGVVSQAPRWMQRTGLEWIYRLSREPRRLWRRYARYNPLFLIAFARQYARHLRRQGRRSL